MRVILKNAKDEFLIEALDEFLKKPLESFSKNKGFLRKWEKFLEKGKREIL